MTTEKEWKENKRIRLLDNLREEALDAKNGIGKSLSEVHDYCNIYQRFLAIFEQKIGITPSLFSTDIYIIPDIEVLEEYNVEFKKLVVDLSSEKILSHKEFMNFKKDEVQKPIAIVTSRHSREITEGKNIVVRDKSGLRKYTNELRDIIKGLEKASKKENNKNEEYRINLKDREIFINEYLLSKPYAVGPNMDFFEYVFDNPNKVIKESDLPKLRGKKLISKIINELGFTSEFLKAFFPKRSKGTVFFRNKINKDDLDESGIDIAIFYKQLEALKSKK